MGIAPAWDNLPSIRIISPSNYAVLVANAEITLLLRSINFHDGVVVNSDTNFLAAPQQLDASGTVIGHYHIVIEQLDALNSTAVNDVRNFTFFKVVADTAAAGLVKTSVPKGLPEGFYRVFASVHASNHQPVLSPIAQRGSLNDAAYVRTLFPLES
jgi:hypothetical protein